MESIKKRYIIDENRQTVAVQINIADFEKLEQLFEDYALGKLIEENDPTDTLPLDKAKVYYDSLDKSV